MLQMWWIILIVVILITHTWRPLKVAPSHRGGHGVFAQRFYLEGSLIERGKFLETRETDVSRSSIFYDYVFQSPTSDKNVVLALGNVSLFNHAATPWLQNASHEVLPSGFVDIVADRLIWPGEEILISYGPDYWSSRGIEPT